MKIEFHHQSRIKSYKYVYLFTNWNLQYTLFTENLKTVITFYLYKQLQNTYIT